MVDGWCYTVFAMVQWKDIFGNVYLYNPCVISLKEYYEIVGESRPLSAFFPKHADFFTEMHF